MKVEINTTMGNIQLELDRVKAPKTVENFRAYIDSGHYEGTVFHRVIKDFMIQGGGLDADMNTLETSGPIENEADNGLSNLAGTIAMARTMEPHSASAQFFINTTDNPFLDHRGKTEDGWGYCVFGKVVEGMDTVEKIEETVTTNRSGYQDVPDEIILIKKIEIISE
jgi:peptidyl-prolyl cis-trans isomerase B (cyclophilin B)